MEYVFAFDGTNTDVTLKNYANVLKITTQHIQPRFKSTILLAYTKIQGRSSTEHFDLIVETDDPPDTATSDADPYVMPAAGRLRRVFITSLHGYNKPYYSTMLATNIYP